MRGGEKGSHVCLRFALSEFHRFCLQIDTHFLVPAHCTSMSDKTKVQELAERKRKEYDERRAAEQATKRQKQLAGVGLDEEEEEAGGLPVAQTQRQREAAERTGRGQELMPLQDESDPEDLVENDLDRDFIDDEGVEPPDEGGYASDGEQRELVQAASRAAPPWHASPRSVLQATVCA